MVITRAEATTIFDYILDNILSRDGSNDLKRALEREGFNDLFSFMTMDDAAIDGLQYQDPNDTSVLFDVLRSDKTMVRLWKQFVVHRESTGCPIGDNWLQVTQQQYDEFRLSSISINRCRVAAPAPTAQGSFDTGSASKFLNVDLFQKEVKHDPSLFPTLDDEKFNDSWHQSFATQKGTQDVDKVLDESYVPVTQEDKELFTEQQMYVFTEQQMYVYAVLEEKVSKDVGQIIVHEHGMDYDAQAVYSKLFKGVVANFNEILVFDFLLAYVQDYSPDPGSKSDDIHVSDNPNDATIVNINKLLSNQAIK